MFLTRLSGSSRRQLFKHPVTNLGRRCLCEKNTNSPNEEMVRDFLSQLSPSQLNELLSSPEKVKAFEAKTGFSLDSFIMAQDKAGHKKTKQLFWENMDNSVRKAESMDKEDENIRKEEEKQWDGSTARTTRAVTTRRAHLPHRNCWQGFSLTHTLWGKFASIQWPSFIQTWINRTYAALCGCNLEEAEKDVSEYPSLAHFFRRNLKLGLRTIDESAQMVCPVDGKLLHFGEISSNGSTIEQVKGISFALRDFLGADSKIFEVIREHLRNDKSKEGPRKHLYYCVIYLAPGDYHGYHSPVDWAVKERVHFPGYLFPVASWAVQMIKGLFAMNERVVLAGEWRHGFFSYTPVGAYNVGSMSLNFEGSHKKEQRANSPPEKIEYEEPIFLKKGENIGFFNMGSTIVMIWEAPSSLFMVARGERMMLGQVLTKEVTPELAKEQIERLKKDYIVDEVQRKVILDNETNN